MYGERGGQVIGCAQWNDSQTSLGRGIVLHELIRDLIDGPITSRCYEDIILCVQHSAMTVCRVDGGEITETECLLQQYMPLAPL